MTKGRLFLCYDRELKTECFGECGGRRGLQGVHRFHKFPSTNSPPTALGLKRHGSFILVTALSCWEHSQIKLNPVKTPSIWAQEEKLFMGLSCSSKRGVPTFATSTQVSLVSPYLPEEGQNPSMALPVNFPPGNTEAVTSFRA